jgi:hypothetical protein
VGAWEGSVALVLSPQAFVPVFAALAT